MDDKYLDELLAQQQPIAQIFTAAAKEAIEISIEQLDHFEEMLIGERQSKSINLY